MNRFIRCQSGMTLIEVMAALVIFALAGTAVMKSAAEHLSSVTQVEEVTFATWVANNRLNEMKLTSSWPPKNNVRGKMEMADRTWYWQQMVSKTTDDDLRAVEVSVGQDDLYEHFQASVITYVSKPVAIAASVSANPNGPGNNQNSKGNNQNKGGNNSNAGGSTINGTDP